MSLLHLATGFEHSSIYKMMFKEISKRDIIFNVYVPKKKYIHSTTFNQDNYSYNIVSSPEINKIETLLYYPRINKMVKGIENRFTANNISFVHAHSLFSDGAVAYRLYKKYKIPYIVAIRDTDVSKYLKYGPHLKKTGYNILNNASNIIFLSTPYKEMLFNRYFTKNNKTLKEKSLVIPNGIDDFWHQNREKAVKRRKNKKISLIFVGKLIKRKNPETVIKVVQRLNELNFPADLKILGTGHLENELKKTYADEDYINFLGRVNDKNELWSHYVSSDVLIVPSLTETFGLVYPEAMSTATPVIYTKGQGFDGVFENGLVGYSVHPMDISQIVESVLNIIEDYDNISKNAQKGSKRFNWSKIVDEYSLLYSER